MSGFEPSALAAQAANPKTQTAAARQAVAVAKEERLAKKEERLANKENQPPPRPMPAPVAAPPPAPAAPVQDRNTLLDLLEAYRKRFPDLKKRHNITPKSSIEEIKEEIQHCERQLGSSTGDDGVGAQVFLAGVNAIEVITTKHWNPLGLRLEGLTAVTRDNFESLSDVIDELTIKYTSGVTMSPEVRLCLTFGALIATVHTANGEAVGQPLSRASASFTPPKDSNTL